MRHRSSLLLILFACFAATVPAQDVSNRVKGTIEKGLAFLAKDAVTWKAEKKCASCHHGPMGLWSLHEAKRQGYAVDEQALAELGAWVIAKDDPAKVFPKPASPPSETPPPAPTEISVNQAPLMLALAFEAGNVKDDAARDGLAKMLTTILDQQRPDGSWGLMYVWEPIGSTPNVMTTLSLLGIASPNAPDLGARGKEAREKGLSWLAAAKADETLQASALKLMLWRELGKPGSELEPIIKRIIALQNADGGWSQSKEFASDAYSTGQTLYALAVAGFPIQDPAIANGQSFLMKTQEPTGAWAMSSRPGGPGGKSAKNLAPIAYTGTAWAVMGLIRTAPPQNDPSS